MARFYPLEVADIRRETPECVSVALHVPPHLADTFLGFRAGQHLVLRLVLNGEELRRTYSICTPEGSGELRIAVKRQPHGRVSGWINEKLRVGDVLEVMPPYGRFGIDFDPKRRAHYVAFAAGSGITPVISILETALQREPQSHFTLFYGNRNTRSIIFRERLEDLKDLHRERLALFHVLSAETAEGMEQFTGRITPEKVRAWAGRLFDPKEVEAFFICGPAPMIQTLATTLQELGVPKERIRYEYFTPEGNQPRTAAAAGGEPVAAGAVAQVVVLLDDERHEFTMPLGGEQTILEAARAHGLDVPFSCTAGVCATCRARLREGRVEMKENYALEEWEIEQGEILTCQARPLSKRLVVDYDVA